MHLGHKGAINLDHRPFYDCQEMEDVSVHNWNAVVRPSDTVILIGDFCWLKTEEWIRILRRLKGNKVLITGNHDLHDLSPALRKMFADVKDYKVVDDNGRKVILSHFPIIFYNHSNNPKTYMLCGHVHATAENDWLEKMDRRTSPCRSKQPVSRCKPWSNL